AAFAHELHHPLSQIFAVSHFSPFYLFISKCLTFYEICYKYLQISIITCHPVTKTKWICPKNHELPCQLHRQSLGPAFLATRFAGYSGPIVQPKQETDVATALKIIRSKYPTVTDFERDFPSLFFALAAGVSKTRLMSAFIA
ncbi:MAG: hypothetical protein LBV12_03715, partial [Puniceicoccales bacterium]|nr:hypothetical protein [Puniceicoccales bacterium]